MILLRWRDFLKHDFFLAGSRGGLVGGSQRGFELYGKLWARYTDNPPLFKIDVRMAAKFVCALKERGAVRKAGAKASPNTVRKHCIHLQYVLDRAGPCSRHNRQGANLVANVVWLERPRSRRKPASDSFTVAEIGFWLDACLFADSPRIKGILPATWWRSLITFIYNTGLRIGTVLQLEWSMIDGEWLNVPGNIYKGGDSKRFYLNAEAREAIAAVRTARDRIFPWPCSENRLHRVRREILKRSAIPAHRHFGFHALRKAVATHLAQANPLVAQMVLGHTSLAMTRDHYVHPDIVSGELSKLPQPKMSKAG